MRHEATLGLIGAKKTGGDAATGDIIVFFDCHVKPAAGYWEPFVAHVAENYRRVVVPTITSLDVTTWVESSRPRGGGGGMSKCYLTFDAEFVVDERRDGVRAGDERRAARDVAPLVGRDGRLRRGDARLGRREPRPVAADLALRRRDRHGADLVRRAHVAHRRQAHARAVRRARRLGAAHRARAAKAHMGDWFVPKVLTFPAFRRFAPTGGDELEVGAMANPPGLSCRPFEWYLRRFAHIYADGGVLPRQVFQLGGARCRRPAAPPAAARPQRMGQRLCAERRARAGRVRGRAEAQLAPVVARGEPAAERALLRRAALVELGPVPHRRRDRAPHGGVQPRGLAVAARGAGRRRAAPRRRPLVRDRAAGLGAVTLGSCRNGATVWARRAAFEPPEFAMLSSQSRDAWPEPGGEQAPAVEEAAEEWLRWHKRHQHFAAGAAVELRD